MRYARLAAVAAVAVLGGSAWAQPIRVFVSTPTGAPVEVTDAGGTPLRFNSGTAVTIPLTRLYAALGGSTNVGRVWVFDDVARNAAPTSSIGVITIDPDTTTLPTSGDVRVLVAPAPLANTTFGEAVFQPLPTDQYNVGATGLGGFNTGSSIALRDMTRIAARVGATGITGAVDVGQVYHINSQGAITGDITAHGPNGLWGQVGPDPVPDEGDFVDVDAIEYVRCASRIDGDIRAEVDELVYGSGAFGDIRRIVLGPDENDRWPEPVPLTSALRGRGSARESPPVKALSGSEIRVPACRAART